MSNLERLPREATGGGLGTVAAEPVRDLLIGREVQIGPRNTLVTRTLPHRDRRLVGAWCFLDHYGPEDITGTPGMRVPPHPHTGLQTVSWLVDGHVLHRDTLGSEQLIRPGQLNLMTAGRGIAHSEESARGTPPILHGVQLWVALPHQDRMVEPDFAHLPELPVISGGTLGSGGQVTVIMGELAGAVSPARTYTPLLGAEVRLNPGGAVTLPLRPDFEHAALCLSGTVTVDEVALGPGPLLYLGCGRSELTLRDAGESEVPGRVLLLGGEPFEEQIIMWWNFVGRSHDEIVEMRADWEGQRFGAVRGYDGEPLPAPPMPTTPLKPRPRTR